MKILIYGANGWIGTYFRTILDKTILENPSIEYVIGKSRTDNKVTLLKEIENISPTHIISFIGRTHGEIGDRKISTIDYLEEPGKLVENVRDNLFSPFLLSEICRSYNIHYTYLGTGCIFKYDDDHPYEEEKNGFTEESLPNFFGSSYSIVKGYTDQMMQLYSDTTLNLRIRMPITGTFSERNFITKITHYKKICSIANSMTVLPEMLPLIIKMMQQNITGTINLTNPGLITHNEILEMYKEIIDPEFKWENFTIEEQNQILASKRSNNHLDTLKLENLYPSVLPIKQAVRKCLENWNKL